jgi:hypothetical protein
LPSTPRLSTKIHPTADSRLKFFLVKNSAGFPLRSSRLREKRSNFLKDLIKAQFRMTSEKIKSAHGRIHNGNDLVQVFINASFYKRSSLG